MFAYIYFFFLLTVTGLSVGSFLNVVIYRLPRGEFFKSARSFCPSCGQTLKPRDLIPLAGFLLNKGKCRFCNAKISLRYPLVEAFTALYFVACFLRFGFTLMSPLAAVFGSVLICVALIDLDTMTIPDSFHVALAIVGLCSLFVLDLKLTDRLIGVFAVGAPLALIAFLLKGAFGGGDIKLMAVCGFTLGWKLILLAFFVALVLGGSFAIYLLFVKKAGRKTSMPFGHYLCVGLVTALFYGNEMIGFYLGLYVF